MQWWNFTEHFYAIYSMSKGAQSEMVTLQLFKSYCFTFMLYATEVMPLSKHSLKTLHFCMSQAVAKIFNTCDKVCIMQIRLACDLPDVSVLIEHCRKNFMNNMLDNEQLHYLGPFCVHCWCACVSKINMGCSNLWILLKFSYFLQQHKIVTSALSLPKYTMKAWVSA